MSAESNPQASYGTELPENGVGAWEQEIADSTKCVIDAISVFQQQNCDLLSEAALHGTGSVVRSGLHYALTDIERAISRLRTEIMKKAAAHSGLQLHQARHEQHDPGQQA
jgi:hypothetical protein